MAEKNDKFIFISYSHKDSDFVIPVIGELKRRGFNIWYDNGIEAGSEWPEFIAEKIVESSVVLVMLSQSALDSHNCRREINFAIEEKKEILVSYVDDVKLSPGMRMQLNVLQALYFSNYNSKEEFTDSLVNSKILAPCKVFEEEKEPVKAETMHIENLTEQTVQEKSCEDVQRHILKADVIRTEFLQETKESTDNQVKFEISKQNDIGEKVTSKPQISIVETVENASDRQNNGSYARVTVSNEKKSEIGKKFDITEVINEYNSTVRKDIRLKRQLKDKQIKNALKHIPSSDYETEENFVALLDMSILESGKEGFLFTKTAMYFRHTYYAMEDKVCSVDYREIKSIAQIDGCTAFYLNNGKILGIEKTNLFDVYKFAEILLKHRKVGVLDFDSLVNTGDKINRAINYANKVKTGKYFQKNWVFHFAENVSEKQKKNATKYITDDSILTGGIIALFDTTKKNTGEKGVVITRYGLYDNLTDSCRCIGFDGMVNVEKDESSKKIKITFRDGKITKSDYSPYPKTIYEFLKFIVRASCER